MKLNHQHLTRNNKGTSSRWINIIIQVFKAQSISQSNNIFILPLVIIKTLIHHIQDKKYMKPFYSFNYSKTHNDVKGPTHLTKIQEVHLP